MAQPEPMEWPGHRVAQSRRPQVRVPTTVGPLPLLPRPRLLRRVSTALSRGSLTIRGLYGSGKESLLLSWQQHTGIPVVWIEGRSLAESHGWPELQVLLSRGTGPVVAAIHASEAGASALDREVAELQSEEPRLRVVHVVGLRGSLAWPSSRGARLSARDLIFTREEIAALVALAGAPLAEADIDAVFADTGGYPLAVAAVVGLARDRGRYDVGVLRASTDALMAATSAAVEEGLVPVPTWRRLLQTTLLEDPTFAQLGAIWRSESPETVAKVLESAGLAALVDDPAGQVRLRLIPSLRAGLRRRLPVELSAAELQEEVTDLVSVLAGDGDLTQALALAAEHGVDGDVADALARHWTGLSAVPADVAIATLRPLIRAAPQQPELATAHLRAMVDVSHAGHSGSISHADRRRAQTWLDELPVAEHAGLHATQLTLAAALARMSGALSQAEGLHARAVARVAEIPGSPVAAAVLVQQALTSLTSGDLQRASDLFAQAQDMPVSGTDTTVASLASEFEMLARGYLGDRHSSAPPSGPDPVGSVGSAVRHVGEAARLVARLDVAGAWEALGRLPVVTGVEDPSVLLVLRAQAEAMAHLLSGTAGAGLGALDVIDALLDGRELSSFETTILCNTRAELLVAVGEPELAIAVLDAAGPPAGLASILVRCVVLLALGRAAEAAELVEPLLPSSSGWAANYPTWMLVISFLTLDELGESERADQLLGRGVAIASRSGAMLPFARQGAERMAHLIDRAGELRLDPSSQELLDRLDDARERMRLSSLRARLSDRELVVLHKLHELGETRRLASALHVSPNTIKSQLQSIYRKLGARTRDEALRAALLLGFLKDAPPPKPS